MPRDEERIVLDLYFEELGRTPLLTPKKERKLGKKILAGRAAEKRITENGLKLSSKEVKSLAQVVKEGIAARQHLVKANLRLGVWVAEKYAGRSLNLTFLGLIQEANHGLMKAAISYDWRKGKFSTYATKVCKKIIKVALGSGRRITSLDDPIADSDGKEESLHGRIGDKKAIAPHVVAGNNMFSQMVREVIFELDPVAQKVMSLLYGLENGRTYNHKKVAKKLNLKEQKVRQIEQASLKWLKRHKKLNKWK